MDKETWEGIGTVLLAVGTAGIVLWIGLFVVIRDGIKERRRDRQRLLYWVAEQRRKARAPKPSEQVARFEFERDERYGDRHQAEREKYADLIREGGGICMERVCIMPSRRIAPGAFWHLAHDHELGGPHDYLGPSHSECNQYEALMRGVMWEGAPTVEQLLAAAKSTPPQPVYLVAPPPHADLDSTEVLPPDPEFEPPDSDDLAWSYEARAWEEEHSDEDYWDYEDDEAEDDDEDEPLADGEFDRLTYERRWPGEEDSDDGDRLIEEYGVTWTDNPWEGRESEPLAPLWMPADVAEEIAQVEAADGQDTFDAR